MDSKHTDKKTVVAWGLWDLGSASFNAVLLTFVFSVYLTDSVGTTINSKYTPPGGGGPPAPQVFSLPCSPP